MRGIIKQVILKNLRSPGYLIFSAIFPIILTLVIGTLMNGVMDTSVELDSKTVYYLDNGTEENSKMLDDIVKNMEVDKFKFTEIDNKESGLDKVEKNEDVFINLDGESIDIYTGSKDKFYYHYIKSFLNSFDKRGEAIELSINENPVIAQEILDDTEFDSVEKEILTGKQSPIGTDYYAITNIVMMAMYLMCFSIEGYDYDRKKGILDRIRLSGTSNLKYIVSSTVGYFLLSFLITAPGILFSKYIMGVNWGDNMLVTYVGIQTLALISISIGTVLAFVTEEKDKVFALVQALVLPILSFLGGVYVPINAADGSTLDKILHISPIRIFSEGVFDNIYLGETESLIRATILGIVAVVILIIIAAKLVNKKKEVRI
ncbi:MAG: ABC transporter permease [Sarcina sp.]